MRIPCLIVALAAAFGVSGTLAATAEEKFYWETVALECGDYGDFFSSVNAYQGVPGCTGALDGALGAKNETNGIYFRLNYKGRFEVTDTAHDTCADASQLPPPSCQAACGPGSCVDEECDEAVFPGAGSNPCDKCQCCIDDDNDLNPGAEVVQGCALPGCDCCTTVCDNPTPCPEEDYHCTEIVSGEVQFTVEAYKYAVSAGWTVLSSPQPTLGFGEVNHAYNEPTPACPAP